MPEAQTSGPEHDGAAALADLAAAVAGTEDATAAVAMVSAHAARAGLTAADVAAVAAAVGVAWPDGQAGAGAGPEGQVEAGAGQGTWSEGQVEAGAATWPEGQVDAGSGRAPGGPDEADAGTWPQGQVEADAGRADRAGAARRRLVTTLVAAHVRGLRERSGERGLADEWALMHAVTMRLNAATTMEATLKAFVLPAPAREEAEVCLCTIDSDAGGEPTWLTLVGVLPAMGKAPQAEVGLRMFLPDMPFARVYLASPGVPVLIGSVADDPRIDPHMREVYLRMGIRAAIVMALTLRGRLVGLLEVYWPRPIALTEREQRLFQALSQHASLLLDNHVMVERLRASLAETRQQGRLLQTVMDHVPVGILCLSATTRAALITNRAARTILGGDAIRLGESPAEVYYPGSDRRIRMEELPGVVAAETGEVHRREFDFVAAGGPRRAVEVTGVPMRDGEAVEQVVVMLTDITGRKQAEAERVLLQEEVIRAQAAALAERSSPLIPITEDVLVMPLVGTIDHARGQGILETALHGARQRRARVTILDITGVPSIDTRAAGVLTDTAQALRLLGVEPVLSGVGPEVAQALVALDVPLAGIVTCGTLQAGIQYAMGRLGRRI